jgi:putative ABC transport system permease protein
MAVVILLSAFLVSEKSYEREYPNINNIYRVITWENTGRVEEIAGENLVKTIPQVKATCRYGKTETFIYYNKNRYNGICVDTDTGIFSIFSLNLQYGLIKDVFQSPKSMVICKSYAKRVFGNINPIGQVIEVNNSNNFTITGICDDFPEKSILKGDFFISYKDKWSGSASTVNNVHSWFNNLFVLLEPKVNAEAVNKTISKEIYSVKLIKKDKEKKQGIENLYRLQPFKDIYFDTSIEQDYNFQYANVELIKLMGWVTMIIIILALVNYVNLVSATGSSRIKEVGIRKTLGVNRYGIFKQYLAESVFTCTFSFLLALVCAGTIKPLFNELTGKEIEITYLFSSPWKLFFVTSFIFATGIVSGMYPALVSSSFTPFQALKQTKFSFDDAVFRRLVNVVQFSVAIFMVICLLVIIKQIEFAKNKDLGFGSEHLLQVTMQGDIVKKKDVIKDQLLKCPGIRNITFSNGIPGNIWMWQGGNQFDDINIPLIPTDENFIPTLDIQLVEGRNFYPEEKDKVIINQSLLKMADWDTYAGKNIFGKEVIGVVKDFHFQDLRTRIGPMMIVKAMEDKHMFTARLAFQNIQESVTYIKKLCKKLAPKYTFDYKFYNENYDSFYKQEERYANTIKVFGVLAILLSCMGLFGLAEFSTKKRTKEIGVRKINGAKVMDVITMLSRDFLVWVVVAFIISAPIAWKTMEKWLQTFAYKTELSWWVFGVAGAVAVVVAVLTVSWQSWRVAMRNPVEALRYE